MGGKIKNALLFPLLRGKARFNVIKFKKITRPLLRRKARYKVVSFRNTLLVPLLRGEGKK